MMDTAYSSAITRNPQLIKAAISYANRGWQIIPLWPLYDGKCTCPAGKDCGSPGKHPWIAWKENGGTTNELQIYKWWRSKPGSGIGVLTGKERSGLFLLDVDGPKGQASLEDKHLPLTPVSNTGRGNHYLFEYPEGANISAGNKAGFMPGLDIRGDGGLFVAPPSLHYSGAVYEWDVSPDEVELAKCPDWLVEALAVEKRPEKQPAQKPTNNISGENAWAKAALKYECDNVIEAAPHTGNDTLNKAAYSLGQIVAGGSLSQYDVENALLDAATYGDRRTVTEAKSTIKSGMEAGMKEPRYAEAPPQLSDMRGGVWVEETGEVLPSSPARAKLVEDDRPEICASEGDLTVVTPQAWEILYDYNNPPRLFMYAGKPQRFQPLEENDKRWALQELNEKLLRYEVTRAAWWFKINKDKEKVSAIPSKTILENMLSQPEIELPQLTKVVETPVFSKTGTIIQTPGYDQSGIYYYPVPGLEIKPVSEVPTEQELKTALDWIYGLITDFNFVDEREKINAVTIFVEPFVRDMIKGTTPLRLIEAPTVGTGKGLLADVLTRHANGQPGLISQCQNEEEWNKSIISQLKSGVSLIMIDNINTTLDSGALAGVLTSESFGGRLLGTNDSVQFPNRAMWIATGNNPTMTTEIARRTIRIRLDSKTDKPWQREGFQHENLRDWAVDNRSNLIWAAMTIVQNWIAKGQPSFSGRVLGSYESWSKVMGGIMEAAGLTGFLENLDAFYEAADSEGQSLRTFIGVWFARFGNKPTSIGALFNLTTEFDIFDLGSGNERSQRIRFARLVARQKDRVIDGYTLHSGGVQSGYQTWYLKKAGIL